MNQFNKVSEDSMNSSLWS